MDTLDVANVIHVVVKHSIASCPHERETVVTSKITMNCHHQQIHN